MTKIIGITGGVGSGKSTLSKKLIESGFKVHDSDQEVEKIYLKPSKNFLSYLKKIGLKKAINKKKINKKYIAKKIFENTTLRKNLEEYIFTIVRKNRSKFIKKEKRKKTKTIFIDVPLLFENNLDKIFHQIVCIISNKKLRYKRLKLKKNINKKLFNNILKSQTSDKMRKKRSHKIIYNNSTMKSYLLKIKKFIKGL